MAEIALPPEVVSVVKRPDVRMIIGAALGGLALGLFIGVKLAGPRTWVPEATEAPCAECEEKRQVHPAPGLTPEQRDDLIDMIAKVTDGTVIEVEGLTDPDVTVIEVEGLSDKTVADVED